MKVVHIFEAKGGAESGDDAMSIDQHDKIDICVVDD
jgi:hypothetical protein